MRVVNKSNSEMVYMNVTTLFGYYKPEVVILYSLKMLNEKKNHISSQGVHMSNKLWSKNGNPMPLMFVNNLQQFNC